MSLKLVSSNKVFAGLQKVFKHESKILGTEATFAIYLPQAKTKVPLIYWLSGLSCTEQNFITKAGAQQYAQKYQVAIVCPDTSPRGANIPGEDDSYDLGTGAGFYVDATQEPWSKNYKMFSYVTKELPEVIASKFGSEVDTSRCSIMGHSMGGHGALVCALRLPGTYKAVSVFAPICTPIPWAGKAFTAYLGSDESSWKAYDATHLAQNYTGPSMTILLDQGGDDQFLSSGHLQPDKLRAVTNEKIKINYREHPGYDHGYYFIATFIEDHIKMHSEALQ